MRTTIALTTLAFLAAACSPSRDVKEVHEPRARGGESAAGTGSAGGSPASGAGATSSGGGRSAVPPPVMPESTPSATAPKPTGVSDLGTSKIALGAKGRAEGVLEVPYASTVSVYLTNNGPGKVHNVSRVEGGPVLREGALTSTVVQIDRGSKKTVVFVLESDGAAEVECRVEQTEYAHETERVPPIRWTTTR